LKEGVHNVELSYASRVEVSRLISPVSTVVPGVVVAVEQAGGTARHSPVFFQAQHVRSAGFVAVVVFILVVDLTSPMKTGTVGD
jgi:hypothetical protein